MPKPWSSVVESQEYQSLPPENREMVRQQYFANVVAPRVDPDHLDFARQQFDADTAPPAQDQTQTQAPAPADATKPSAPFGVVTPEMANSVDPRETQAMGASSSSPADTRTFRDRLTDFVSGVFGGKQDAQAARELEQNDPYGVERPSNAGRQFVAGVGSGATAGLVETGEPSPEGTAQNIANGLGKLTGFIAGLPVAAGEAIAAKTFAKILAPVATDGAAAAIAKGVALDSAKLATMFTVSESGKAIDQNTVGKAVKVLGEAAKQGAEVGASFSGVGRILPGTALWERAARIGTISAFVDLANGTTPWDERDLAQKAFDYGMNVFFSWTGTRTPYKRPEPNLNTIDMNAPRLAQDNASTDYTAAPDGLRPTGSPEAKAATDEAAAQSVVNSPDIDTAIKTASEAAGDDTAQEMRALFQDYRLTPVSRRPQTAENTTAVPEVPATQVSPETIAPVSEAPTRSVFGQTSPEAPQGAQSLATPTDTAAIIPAQSNERGVPPAEQSGVPVAGERRLDAGQRRRVADMTHDEMRISLLTDHLTGIPNSRSYDEAERLPVQSRVDLDGFKAINDNYGHPSGDEVLKTVAHYLDKNKGPGRVYRIGGDEFPGEFHSDTDARAAMEATRQDLAKHQFTFELPDGSQKTFTGVGFSYGIGHTEDAAETALRADKAKRASEGLRSSNRAPAAGDAGVAEGKQDTAVAEEVAADGKDSEIQNERASVGQGNVQPATGEATRTTEERTNAADDGPPRTSQKEVTQTPSKEGVSVSGADKFPPVSGIEISVGLGGRIKPKPIAPGRPLFRETSIDGLDSLLRYDQQADTARIFVTDNPDLAIGQGENRGVFLEFRKDSLSGSEHLKPGTGDLSGREYQTDIIAPRAISAITMNAIDVKRLRGLTKLALRDFERQDIGDGRVRYMRKAAQPKAPPSEGLGVSAPKKGPLTSDSVLAEITAAGQEGIAPRNATWRLMAKRLERQGKAKEIDGKFVAKEDDKGTALYSRKVSREITETPEFKRWFGKSKVVDDDGKPLVVYHGTDALFNVFDKRERGRVTETSDAKVGFWFSESRDRAKQAARDATTMSDTNIQYIKDVYLKVNNPYYADEAAFELLDDPEATAKIIKRAKRSGHDGVYFPFEGGSWVVFEPTQIKSATGNRTFAPDNPDINFSRTTEAAPSGLSASRASEILAIPLKRLSDTIPVEIVQSTHELPFDAPDDVRGAYHQGKVWLVADNLTEANARRTLTHEVVGHLGLEQMLGADELKRLLRDVNLMKRAGNKAVQDAAAHVYDTHGKLDRDTEAKEIIAHMAERGIQNSLIRRIVAAIREFLARMGLWFDKGTAGIESLIARAARYVEGHEAETRSPEVSPAFSRSGEPNSAAAKMRDIPETEPGQKHTEPTGVTYFHMGINPKEAIENLKHVPLVKSAVAAGDKLVMFASPMATMEATHEARAVAKDFANRLRYVEWRRSRFDDMLRARFTASELKAMWEAQAEESVLLQKGEDAQGKGLDRLAKKQRDAVNLINEYGHEVWEAAKEAGVVKGEGLPAYAPYMFVQVAEDGTVDRVRSGDEKRPLDQIGINLTTAGPKQRKHLTPEESEAAAKAKLGKNVEIVRDIRTLPLAIARLEKAVAGRKLIDAIKEQGKLMGDETVSEHEQPGFFTLDHPAFKSYKPRLAQDEKTGKWKMVEDENGNPIFDRVPLYVRQEFEGPLRAVLTKQQGEIEKALMTLKGKSMSVIMYSPMIHNAVEFGRALPLMKHKIITAYFVGNKIKNDPAVMQEAINTGGLVPIGHRFFNQDITGIAEGPDLKPGRSLTAKAAGYAIGLTNEGRREAVMRAIDTAGDFWHNTLLWDRVGDLQMGIYKYVLDQGLKKGLERSTAVRVAAHAANRYAGALPNEAMSRLVRNLTNLTFFSRTFTFGNLGVMKDVMNGLPQDVRGQIKRDAGQLQMEKARSMSRHKAIQAFLIDIALFYVANSLLQDMLDYWLRDKDADSIVAGYGRRLNKWMRAVKDSPFGLIKFLAAMSSTSENEPGKEDRVLFGFDKNGRAIYLRNPTGKLGEDFAGWLTSPLDMLERKESTAYRAIDQVRHNDKGFGRRVYDQDDKSFTGMARAAGNIAQLFIESQLPMELIRGTRDMATGAGDQKVNALKVFGPLAGVTFSLGHPAGPDAGYVYTMHKQANAKKADILPEVNRLILNGKEEEARTIMDGLGMKPDEINGHIKFVNNPSIGKNTSILFNHESTDNQQEELKNIRK